MQESKLVNLLKCLELDTIRRLRKVLESSFFTSNENLLHLYKHLRKYYPDFDHPRLKKEIVYAKIFPHHAYSDAKMRNLMSEFATLVEELIVKETLEKNQYLRQKILLDFYQNQKGKLYLKTLNKLTAQLNQLTYRDPEYYSEAFQLTMRHTEWSAENNQIEEVYFRNKEADFLLSNYYGLMRAQLQLARKASHASNKDIQKEKPLILFDQQVLESNLLYQLYQKLEQLLKGEVKAVSPFLEELTKGKTLLKASTRRELFVTLLNYCIGQMQNRDTEFLPIVFDLYQFGLAEEILLENQRISATTFLNIVIVGGRMEASKWTRDFLKKYAPYLTEEERTDVLVLGKAYLFFYTKEFIKTLQTLSQYTFQNPLRLYPARTYVLRAYLELYGTDPSYLDSLQAQCAAFEKYIRRNDLLSIQWKEAALAFEKMIRKIVNAGYGNRINPAKKRALKAELEAIPLIESRKWLLEKLENF